ncbi:MAG: selenide, water dikinase SelD, partial [Deltaproteobacteria bacterium]|nr:selenide, water dikinase SelD [Deltaproteobacteria bacterium]
MDPVGLATLLAGLPQADDDNLLVGYKTSDDAGIYRLRDDLAIVTTADFITPPVNDPYVFGQIAAANAISDVYAMGGDPKVCLNLVCFPSKKLPADDLNSIIAGALSKITEAGAVLAGGHSVEDSEPKFGLSVIGTVHPDNYWGNGGAQEGDVLILTKPLGSGVLFNANIKGWVSVAALDSCIAALIHLNKSAAEVLKHFDVHAATDVTGFGLAGHALEMAKASGAALKISLEDLPVMDEALTMYQKGMSTGVNKHNEMLVKDYLQYLADYPEWHKQILLDPQTSGGLLVAIPEEQAAELV